jgi:hypothetical protein
MNGAFSADTSTVLPLMVISIRDAWLASTPTKDNIAENRQTKRMVELKTVRVLTIFHLMPYWTTCFEKKSGSPFKGCRRVMVLFYYDDAMQDYLLLLNEGVAEAALDPHPSLVTTR